MKPEWKEGSEQLAEAISNILVSEDEKLRTVSEVWDTQLSMIREEEVPASVWKEMMELKADLSSDEIAKRARTDASRDLLSVQRLKEHLTRMAFWPNAFHEID